MDKVFKVIQLLAALFSIVLPCILFSGYIYHIGYIRFFGLDGSLLPRSFSDMVAESWYLGALVLIYVMPKWWFICFIPVLVFVFLLLCSYFGAWLKANNKLWLLEEFTKEKQGRMVFGITQ